MLDHEKLSMEQAEVIRRMEFQIEQQGVMIIAQERRLRRIARCADIGEVREVLGQGLT